MKPMSRFKARPARRHLSAWALACAVVCHCLHAAHADELALADTIHLANQRLQLNGSAVGQRFVFKVYSIGLYLQEPTSNTQEVLQTQGPRRLAIAMLREVSGEDFSDAIKDFLAESAEQFSPVVLGQVRALCDVIAQLPTGLRKGSQLTIDWVPGTGAVVELDHERLIQPRNDATFFNALLNVWLGDKPLDPSIKANLLGQRHRLHAAS
jgi:hypothetical protein